ncbi:MAG: nucleotidyltransferase [Candidatus Aphodocola sp.]
MIKVGIIAEYNPFHNGHIYHLNKVKEMFPEASLILILAGNFTQRGDVSVINKWDKVKIALDYGFDLVIELPFNIATSSASLYAKGAIDILNKLNCDYLVFGSETNDVSLFKNLVNITKDNEKYEKKVKYYLDKGYNYPKACSLALYDISKVIIDKPNDVLALEYVRSIINTNSKIKPVSIKRTNNYHEEEITGNITSATSIRKNLKNKEIIKNAIPNESLKLINNISLNDYFDYIKYEIISNDKLDEILDVDEGIENKLKKEIHNSKTVEELILNVKSKRYSYNRIKRMLLHILTNTKKDYDTKINYLRILGFNNKGTKILKEAKKYIDVPIITKYKKEYDALFKNDVKASMLYSLITNYDYKMDFKTSIKKDI